VRRAQPVAPAAATAGAIVIAIAAASATATVAATAAIKKAEFHFLSVIAMMKRSPA
jgi:hypothetical protein